MLSLGFLHVGALRVTVLVVLAVLVHVSLSAPSSPSASPPDMPSPLAVTPSTTPMAVLTEPVFSLRAKVLALVLAAGLLALVIVLFVRWSHFREQVHLPHRSLAACPRFACAALRVGGVAQWAALALWVACAAALVVLLVWELVVHAGARVPVWRHTSDFGKDLAILVCSFIYLSVGLLVQLVLGRDSWALRRELEMTLRGTTWGDGDAESDARADAAHAAHTSLIVQ